MGVLRSMIIVYRLQKITSGGLKLVDNLWDDIFTSRQKYFGRVWRLLLSVLKDRAYSCSTLCVCASARACVCSLVCLFKIVFVCLLVGRLLLFWDCFCLFFMRKRRLRTITVHEIHEIAGGILEICDVVASLWWRCFQLVPSADDVRYPIGTGPEYWNCTFIVTVWNSEVMIIYSKVAHP